MLSSTDNDWPVVEQNLWRARVKLGHLTKILRREGVDKRTEGRLYLAVVQAVLLFGSETWVLTPQLDKALVGFHHRVARRHGRWQAWDPDVIRTGRGCTHPLESL